VALNELIRQADITWHGVKLDEPDWRHPSHSVAFTARFTRDERRITSSSTHTGSRVSSSSRRSPMAVDILGADGSILSWSLRAISSSGSMRPGSPAIGIAPSHAPWSCCTRVWNRVSPDRVPTDDPRARHHLPPSYKSGEGGCVVRRGCLWTFCWPVSHSLDMVLNAVTGLDAAACRGYGAISRMMPGVSGPMMRVSSGEEIPPLRREACPWSVMTMSCTRSSV
jgi:hypothetical protein